MEYRNIGKWFHLLERRSQLFIAHACAPRGITVHEYNLLVNLYENEGVSQEEMAAILQVDKASAARTAKALEEKGLIARQRDAADKRVKKLYSTAAGKAQEAFLLSVLRRWIDFLSEGMDEAAVQTMLKGFRDLSEKAARADFSEIR